MATVPRTHKDQSTDESDKKREDEVHRRNEWAGVVRVVLLLLGLFALVACLASL